jgi:hypothetical protein
VTAEDLAAAPLDATVGAVMFSLFGFWFGVWWVYVGIRWALGMLRLARFRFGR